MEKTNWEKLAAKLLVKKLEIIAWKSHAELRE